MKYCIATTLLAALAVGGSAFAKPPIPTPPETPVIGPWDQYFLQTLYKEANPDTGLVEIVGTEKFNQHVEETGVKLLGGPMLGGITPTQARVWVRTAGPATVQVVIDDEIQSVERQTGPDGDYTAVLHLDGLAPATDYTYDVLVNGQPVFGDNKPTFNTFPRKGDPATFSVGFGGCARYNPPKEHVWATIASVNPDAFLMLGDNVYHDLPQHRTKQRVHYYRRQLHPDYQKLTSTTPMYAIYDDHDLGVNDSAGGLGVYEPAWKYESWKVFRENWNNPFYGMGDSYPGCWFDFSIGDVDFFMLDGRYYRDFKQGTMLGPVQKIWLQEKLKASTATFKVLVSGTLWTEHADKGGKDSWWGVKKEREEVLGLIDRENITGIVLLSSDRHRTEVFKLERPAGYDLYEFNSGKLTNIHTHDPNPHALFSHNEGNFFGLLKFDLAQDDPTVSFRVVTIDNELVHETTVRESQLRADEPKRP
ncbi:alkaline phosphatase D family protein [Algisphaera agarilytica]|uniref:Alkaline phosphatase D n=1 Tax=Algisphaera agarilytica TaxID=1385975 RepID=A0A7X0LJM8_9BACT|nr:alkaline phosphatase D family protein [Algisphaera agarilytica]MBB6428776.1 alkaline phosphatase D [Algisphaera agarilytica]